MESEEEDGSCHWCCIERGYRFGTLHFVMRSLEHEEGDINRTSARRYAQVVDYTAATNALENATKTARRQSSLLMNRSSKLAVNHTNNQQYQHRDNRNRNQSVSCHPITQVSTPKVPQSTEREREKKDKSHLRAIPLKVFTLRST